MLFHIILPLFYYRVAFCDNIIDMDDILSADFMPGSLLLLENPQQRSIGYTNSSTNNSVESVNGDGGVDAALTTMGYHR